MQKQALKKDDSSLASASRDVSLAAQLEVGNCKENTTKSKSFKDLKPNGP